ncbi:MAG: (deoxy)nucleoside triphosphate pyrophosphohydrolase [Pseudobdellovibrionaceae bacterium]
MDEKSKPILVVAAVIRRLSDPQKRILVVRRGPGQSGAGMWEFPGGKVEVGETPEKALVREIQEELHLTISVGELIGEEEWNYPAKTIRLRVYWAETSQDNFYLVEHDLCKWSLPEEINISELLEADRPFVKKICQGSK